ncbi:MAG TPA: hypothetical protein VMA37_10875 [Acetobacteraceae bacterium]|nr:hypothetical protein [Acetobacteraceae bacterium]
MNNAGANFFHGVLGSSEADTARCFGLDFYPVWAICQEAYPALKSTGRGWRPRPANDSKLALMRRIDELFLCWPFLRSRRMAVLLWAGGEPVNRKRMQRLTRRMEIAAVGPPAGDQSPRLSRPPSRSTGRPVETRN